MVIDYLEKMHHQMYKEKIKLEREYQKKEILLKDTSKFIKTLEDSLDENFESFTPWKIYHENHSKIDILKENIITIKNEMQQLKIQIEDYNNQIDEILKVLEYSRSEVLFNKEIEKKKSVSFNKNVSRETNDLIIQEESVCKQKIIESVIIDLDKIQKKINNCIKFIEVDTIRSHLELQSLSKQVSDIIQKYKK